MSGTVPPVSGGAGDPSMDDILASIRRILNEEDAAAAGGGAPPSEAMPEQPNAGGSGGTDEDEVLVLDEAMLVPVPEPVVETPTIAPPAFESPVIAAPMDETPVMSPAALPVDYAPLPPIEPGAALLAPETAAAAATSVGALLRTISEERTSQVHRGGPTIEDLVREEVRPLLKHWLDHYLPPMVERLVRAEIERVTGRAAP